MKWITILFAVLMSITLVSGSYYSFSDQISWWEFDSPASNSTFAPDSTGSNDGIVTNADNGTTGYFNEGYEFHGANSLNRIDLGNGGFEETMCNNGCSFSMWIYPKQVNWVGTMMGRFDIATQYFMVLSFGSSQYNTPAFRIYTDGTATPRLKAETPDAIAINNWHHVVGVYNGSNTTAGNVKIYVNGILKATSAETGILNSTAWTVTETLYLGLYDYNKQIWNGTLDEGKIFTRPITGTEVAELNSCRTPNNGTGIWEMNGDCTVTGESDSTNVTLKATAGTYIADNSEIYLEKAVASGGKIVATNGGKIIAGT